MAWLLWLASCSVLPATGHAQDPPQAVPTAAAVSIIALERNCFGCAEAGVVQLRRDGSATVSAHGQARLGTASRIARGTIRPQDFDALARLLVDSGFFAMQDVYQPADVADGAWIIVSATAGFMRKQVFSREGAGPDGLRRIEAAIDAARATLAFQAPP
jgi:hypothetical protein